MSTIFLLSMIVCIVIIAIILIVVFLKTNRERYENFYSYKDLDKCLMYNITENERHIPKIIFRTAPFEFDKLPGVIIKNMSLMTKINPDYSQVYFSDNDVIDFIEENFPEYMEYYDLIIPGAFKADFWRLLVLYKYGGVYIDIGYMPVTKLDDFMDVYSDEFIVPVDVPYAKQGLHNAFICSFPQHPFIKMCIDQIVLNIQNRFIGDDPLDITGPGLLGKIFLENVWKSPDKIYNNIYIIDGYKYNFIASLTFVENYQNDVRNRIVYPSNHIKNKPVTLFYTKFPNYRKIMYKNRKTDHYSVMWKKKMVYKNYS